MFPTENDFGWLELQLESATYYENMNIRLRELIASREPHITPVPAAEPIAPQLIGKKMSVIGLQTNVIQAAIEKAKARLVAKTNEGVSKIDTVTAAGEAKIDGVTSNLAAQIDKEIEDQVSAFVTMTNGGPV